jgi:hypothetical protein
MNIALYLLMSLTSSNAQNTGAPWFSPFILMDTVPMRALGNLTIGSLPYGTNSSVCSRIGMFKFPALASGIASSITMNVLPSLPAMPYSCDLRFTLYEYTKQALIGNPFIGTFTNSAAAGSATSLGFIAMTFNASRANWLLTNGTLYYMVIQASNDVSRCNMKVPWGVAAPPYAVVVQRADQPCTTASWTTVTASDGGFIQIRISGSPLSNTPTVTPSRTPVAPAYVSASNSGTDSSTPSQTPVPPIYVSPSNSGTPSPSNSGTPSPSSSGTPSPSNSGTPSPSSSGTPSTSLSNTPTLSNSNSPTTSSSYTNPDKVPINTNVTEQIQAAALGTRAEAEAASAVAIAGGVVGSLVVISLVSLAIMIAGKSARSPVSSTNVITMNPANQMMHFHTNV